MTKNAKQRITLERTFRAPVEDVWDLWTTKEGIESWWGPDGFVVEVRSMDLRPGGVLHYAMIAKEPEMIAFMKQRGMPITTEATITYSDIVPRKRLEYTHKTDFVPGVEPYDVVHLVELQEGASGVRLLLTIDAMHDAEWTKRMVAGWESELGKLEKVIASRR